MPETKIRTWRKARGLSQQAAAALIGVSQAGYCRIEDGSAFPEATTIRCILYATIRLGPYQVTAQDLWNDWLARHPMNKNDRATMLRRIEKVREPDGEQGKQTKNDKGKAAREEASR